MNKFTLSLVAAAAVATASSGEALAAELATANAAPKVIAAARTASAAPAAATRVLHKPAKKELGKSFIGRSRARHAAAAVDGVIYSCTFGFLTEGSETDPAELELDDWDNIPEEMIGEENYGFGGQGLMQAGGAVFIPFEYNEDPDSDYPWYLEGMLWTPDIYEPMEVTVELDVKITENCDVDTDELWIYASDYSSNFDYDSGDIDKEWAHLTLKINAKDFVAESDDDSYYFTLFADGGADIVIKNVVIKGEKAELQLPVAQGYTDYTGTSFTAHWSEVEGATGYYLTVYNFDPTTRTNTSTFLDAQFTADNFYTVEGLTPGNFYSYDVTATNGSFTTSASNRVVVCELPAPQGVTLSAGDDDMSIIASWTATPGANYYVVTATASHPVTAGQTVVLADADFSDIESTGTVAEPEESDYWYDSLIELPGWQFNLGCSAPGAYGFWDNAQYTAMTGLVASLASMDYDLTNIKDGRVDLSVEAASPGNGMLAGLLAFNDAESQYEVASAWGSPADVPEEYETYTFSLSGAAARTQFLFATRTDGNEDGAILIRNLKITGEAAADGNVVMPAGILETAATSGELGIKLEDGVTYSATVVPYLVDNSGVILATGKPSEPATFQAELSGIEAVSVDATDAPAAYYDLHGRRVASPERGATLIKVAGAKATKVRY